MIKVELYAVKKRELKSESKRERARGVLFLGLAKKGLQLFGPFSDRLTFTCDSFRFTLSRWLARLPLILCSKG